MRRLAQLEVGVLNLLLTVAVIASTTGCLAVAPSPSPVRQADLDSSAVTDSVVATATSRQEVTQVFWKDHNGICEAGDGVSYEMMAKYTDNSCTQYVEVTAGLSVSIVCDSSTIVLRTQDPTMACARTFTTEERDENNIIIRYAGEVTASTTPENTAGASNDDVVGAIGTAKVNLDVQGEWTDGGMKDGLANVNETVSFNYKISNIGSTSLLDFCLTDANLGNGCLECMSPGTGIVAPRDSFTCHFIHQVNQDDIDNGWVDSSATITARSHLADDVEALAVTTVVLNHEASIKIVETGAWIDTDSSTYPDKGEMILYEILVSNEGTVTLYNIDVTDTSGHVSCADTASPTVLGVGGWYKCTSFQQLTQADINSGEVSNAVMVVSTARNGDTLTGSITRVTPLEQSAQMEIVNPGTWNDAGGSGRAGYANELNIIKYNLRVTNLGNVDLTGVSVSDPTISHDCDVVAELGVGETISCEGTYSLTWNDIRVGSRESTAMVTAMVPGAIQSLSNFSTDETELRPSPSIMIEMEGLFMDDGLPQDNVAVVGETILDPPLISAESNESALECNMDATVTENTIVLADSLAVGDWFMCAASHILTSGDIDDLERDSFATGFAKDWYDFEVSASDAEVVKLNQVGSVRLEMAPTYTNETITTSNDQALHTHNITNNDLQSVYNIELVCVENEIPLSCDEVRGDSVEGEFAGTDTGHATYPDNELSPAASLTGSLTDEVSQVQIDAGMQTGSATLKVTDERDADQFGDEPIVVHDHDYDGDLGEAVESWAGENNSARTVPYFVYALLLVVMTFLALAASIRTRKDHDTRLRRRPIISVDTPNRDGAPTAPHRSVEVDARAGELRHPTPVESAIVVHRGVNLEEILSAALHARLMSMHDLLDALRLELRRQGVATAIAKGKGAIWRYLLGAVCTERTIASAQLATTSRSLDTARREHAEEGRMEMERRSADRKKIADLEKELSLVARAAAEATEKGDDLRSRLQEALTGRSTADTEITKLREQIELGTKASKMVTHKLESELSSVREKLKAVRYEVEGAKKEKVEAGAMTDVVDTSEKGTMVTTEGCWERVKAAAITIETEARRYLARSRARSLWVLSGQLGDFNRGAINWLNSTGKCPNWCYANSTIQAMFCFPGLEKLVTLYLEDEITRKKLDIHMTQLVNRDYYWKSGKVVLELAKCFKVLRKKEHPVNADGLLSALSKIVHFDTREQQDAGGLVMDIFNAIEQVFFLNGKMQLEGSASMFWKVQTKWKVCCQLPRMTMNMWSQLHLSLSGDANELSTLLGQVYVDSVNFNAQEWKHRCPQCVELCTAAEKNKTESLSNREKTSTTLIQKAFLPGTKDLTMMTLPGMLPILLGRYTSTLSAKGAYFRKVHKEINFPLNGLHFKETATATGTGGTYTIPLTEKVEYDLVNDTGHNNHGIHRRNKSFPGLQRNCVVDVIERTCKNTIYRFSQERVFSTM